MIKISSLSVNLKCGFKGGKYIIERGKPKANSFGPQKSSLGNGKL